jgi:hypothetical protein
VTDFTGWVVVLLGARTLVGKRNGDLLSPCYELHINMQRQGNEVGLSRSLTPILLWDVRAVHIDVTQHAFVHVTDLHPTEQKEIARMIAGAEQIAQNIRMANTGLVLPGKQ